MKKRVLSLFLALILCLGLLPTTPALAAGEVVDSGYCGEEWGGDGTNLSWTFTSDGTLTISGTGAMNDYSNSSSPWEDYNQAIVTVVIQEGVTTIGSNAFMGCYNLTDVTFPESLTTVGNSAFENCDDLTDVTFQEGLTTIGFDAFESCDALTSVTFPDSLETIGRRAFYECHDLSDVTFPESLTTIGDYAFSSCRALTDVTFPKKLTAEATIGRDAFENCSALTIDLTLPEGLTTIGYHAFSGSGLTGVTFPKSLTTIGGYAFENCDILTDVTFQEGLTTIDYFAFYGCDALTDVTFPASVDTIGSSAFEDCGALTDVTFQEGLTTIGASAFEDCRALSNVTLPDSLNTIGNYAFGSCSLTDVTIPAGVTSIGNGSFRGCEALTRITVAEGNPAYIAEDGVLFNKDRTTLIQYPIADPRATYKVPDGVTTISVDAFSGCDALTDVTFPEGLTTIGEDAFENCDDLTDVTFPVGLTTIGSGAFWNCGSLVSVIIPASVTTIGSSAFGGSMYNTPPRVRRISARFFGDAPRVAMNAGLFSSCTLTVFYPKDNSTWTETAKKLVGYGARDITWVEVGPEEEVCTVILPATQHGKVTAEPWTGLAGETASLTVTPDSGYELDTLTVTRKDGTAVPVTEDHTFVMPDSIVTAAATFRVIPTYTVTVADAQNGRVTASPTTDVRAGREVTLRVYPDSGYVLDKLTVTQADGTAVEVTDNTFPMPAADVTVTPTFKALPVYSVTVADTQHGTVTADPTSATAGTKVTLTVTPDEGYELDALTVKQADGTAVTVAADNTFTMPDSDATVTATFKALPPATYTVTVDTALHGAVTASPTSGTEGTKVTLTVTPDKGYELDALTVKQADGTAVTVAADNTFTMPASNVTVSATFKAVTYTVTVTNAQHGKVTASPTGGTVGTKVTLTVTPDEGYELDALTVKQADGTAVAVAADNIFTMPASNVTVTATFKAVTYTVTVATAQHGKVTADPNKGTAGTKVTLTVTPDSGYELDALTVKQADGTAVTVAADNTFTMPASNVTVAATFKALSAENKLSLSKSAVSVKTGSSDTVTATVTGYTGKSVRAVSANTRVATVAVKDKTITVTGVSVGSTTVYVAMTDAVSLTLEQAKADPSVKEIKVTVTKASSSTGGGGGSTGGGSTGGSTGGGGGSTGGSTGGTTGGSSGSTGGSSGGSGGSTGSTTTPTAPATQTFTDVAKGSWYEPGVTFVVGKGLFNGVGANQFAPNTNMTRGMLMTVLARLAGQSTDGGATWYAKGMVWAKAQGVSDGTNPETNITREQLVTMLYRYAKSPAVDAAMGMAGFTDVASISDWAQTAMRWAVQKGILIGKDGGRLDPQGTATRAEVATILQRYVNL